jgi:hypothetical protein
MTSPSTLAQAQSPFEVAHRIASPCNNGGTISPDLIETLDQVYTFPESELEKLKTSFLHLSGTINSVHADISDKSDEDHPYKAHLISFDGEIFPIISHKSVPKTHNVLHYKVPWLRKNLISPDDGTNLVNILFPEHTPETKAQKLRFLKALDTNRQGLYINTWNLADVFFIKGFLPFCYGHPNAGTSTPTICFGGNEIPDTKENFFGLIERTLDLLNRRTNPRSPLTSVDRLGSTPISHFDLSPKGSRLTKTFSGDTPKGLTLHLIANTGSALIQSQDLGCHNRVSYLENYDSCLPNIHDGSLKLAYEFLQIEDMGSPHLSATIRRNTADRILRILDLAQSPRHYRGLGCSSLKPPLTRLLRHIYGSASRVSLMTSSDNSHFYNIPPILKGHINQNTTGNIFIPLNHPKITSASHLPHN